MQRACLVCAVLIGAIAAAARPASAQGSAHEFRICTGDFALCAASTCTPTGGTIEVNTASGTASFPAAECVCPILSGHSIADLKGGNMKGSCEPPSPDGVWSLYAPMENIPQAINDWSTAPEQSAASPFVCAASLGLGNQFANCFSFACVRSGTRNGVPVATCTCPLGESLSGTPVAANTGFITQAGQCDPDVCSRHPVSGPIPFEKPQGCLVEPAAKSSG